MNDSAFVDLAGHAFVPLPGRRRADEVGVPGVDLAQIGVPAADERAGEVQRRGRGVVGADHAGRIGKPGVGGELEAVDHVAAICRQRDLAACFGRSGPRLGVLPSDPAHLHDRDARRIRQHDRHLEQGLELVPDVVGRDAVEGLGAVAALEQERLPAGHRGQPIPQLVALAGEDQRREQAELANRSIDGVGVWAQPGCWAAGNRLSTVGELAEQRVVGGNGHRARLGRRRPLPG